MGSGASSSASIRSGQNEDLGNCEKAETKQNSKDEQRKGSRSSNIKSKEQQKVSRSKSGKTKETSESSRSQKGQDGNERSTVDETNEDNISTVSKDSDDTLVVYARMKSYGKDAGDDLTADCDDVFHDDIIDLIADENLPCYVLYDVDTIGYYIGHGSRRNHGNESAEVNEKPLTTIPEVEQNAEQKNKTQNETSEPFEEFKRIYGIDNPQKTTKKKVACKQTLILTKVGSQYKYVAVPAYLPGQRTYHARSPFTKGFMERASRVYAVKRAKPKGPRVTRTYPARTKRKESQSSGSLSKGQ